MGTRKELITEISLKISNLNELFKRAADAAFDIGIIVDEVFHARIKGAATPNISMCVKDRLKDNLEKSTTPRPQSEK